MAGRDDALAASWTALEASDGIRVLPACPSSELLEQVIAACAAVERVTERDEDSSAEAAGRALEAARESVASALELLQTIAERAHRATDEDTLWMARMALRQRAAGLAEPGRPRELLCRAAGGRREVLRVLRGLSAAGLLELPERARAERDVALALEIRRAYARLRRAVMADGEPTPELLGQRLRSAGAGLSKLCGRAVFCHVRVEDRTVIRQMRERVRDWLARAPQDPEAGIRLWQDLVSMCAFLGEISKRAELAQHDSELCARAWAAWEDGAQAEACSVLAPLTEHDDELAALLGAPGPRASAALGEWLEQRTLASARWRVGER